VRPATFRIAPRPMSETTDGQNPQGSLDGGKLRDVTAYLQRSWAKTSRENPTLTVSPQARAHDLLTSTELSS
jgi:hypothetical protein